MGQKKSKRKECASQIPVMKGISEDFLSAIVQDRRPGHCELLRSVFYRDKWYSYAQSQAKAGRSGRMKVHQSTGKIEMKDFKGRGRDARRQSWRSCMQEL